MTNAEAVKLAKIGRVLAKVDEAFELVEGLEVTKARMNDEIAKTKAELEKTKIELAHVNQSVLTSKQTIEDLFAKAKADADKIVEAGKIAADDLIAEANKTVAAAKTDVSNQLKRVDAAVAEEASVRGRIDELQKQEKIVIERLNKLREDARKQLGI